MLQIRWAAVKPKSDPVWRRPGQSYVPGPGILPVSAASISTLVLSSTETVMSETTWLFMAG
jgi:hypothetical protein